MEPQGLLSFSRARAASVATCMVQGWVDRRRQAARPAGGEGVR